MIPFDVKHYSNILTVLSTRSTNKSQTSKMPPVPNGLTTSKAYAMLHRFKDELLNRPSFEYEIAICSVMWIVGILTMTQIDILSTFPDVLIILIMSSIPSLVIITTVVSATLKPILPIHSVKPYHDTRVPMTCHPHANRQINIEAAPALVESAVIRSGHTKEDPVRYRNQSPLMFHVDTIVVQ